MGGHLIATVWVTTDESGTNVVSSGITDTNGQVVFYLDAGTYYVWREKAIWNFFTPTRRPSLEHHGPGHLRLDHNLHRTVRLWPTIHEIADHVGTATSNAHRQVDKLARAGKIVGHWHRARSIRLPATTMDDGCFPGKGVSSAIVET